MAYLFLQIAYILGASGHSFVVGYGCNPPVNPHHRDSALTLEESGEAFKTKATNANSLIGALVGGPNKQDGWKDDQNDFEANEVALDYNAALLFGTVQVGRS
jgi:endoglucanase